MTNYRIAVLIIIVFILALAGAFFIYQKQTSNQTQEPSPSPAEIALPSPSPPAPAKAQGPSLNEQPAAGSDTVEVKNIGIKVENPRGSTIIFSPVTVSGSANVFEGKVVINIKDANGKTLGQGETTACMGYDACPFETTIAFQTSSTQAGIIEVFSPSGLDGSPQYQQNILIRF